MDNGSSGWEGYICPSCGAQVEQGNFHVCNMRWEPDRDTQLTEIVELLKEIRGLLREIWGEK